MATAYLDAGHKDEASDHYCKFAVRIYTELRCDYAGLLCVHRPYINYFSLHAKIFLKWDYRFVKGIDFKHNFML